MDTELMRDIGRLEEKVDQIIARSSLMEQKVDRLDRIFERWRGVAMVMLLLGGILTWIADALIKLVRH